jgi:hypothetical protein
MRWRNINAATKPASINIIVYIKLVPDINDIISPDIIDVALFFIFIN